MIAEIVFNIPLERSFHYLVPQALTSTIEPGMRVLAPFGVRELTGMIIDLPARSPITMLKSIRRVVDPIPVIRDERWELARWVAEYYYCSFGEALSAMVPSALRLPETPPVREPSVPTAKGPRFTSHQQRAFRVIQRALAARAGTTVLIHGVTGSGKTELYLRAIQEELAHGRGAICLVPEIALTAQTIDRFRERFGTEVAVWHSRLTARQRAAAWQRVCAGQCRIVIGARSAVFAPVRHLGLIVLDEEQEEAFKQESTPRYHARDVARVRVRLAGATLLLGSATPSVETYFRCLRMRDQLVTLPERVQGRRLPNVEIVDMRGEFGNRRHTGPLSARLARALSETVERGEQAMLLLNRRGFARVAQCQTCGLVMRCERCSVPLVYHASDNALVCHYCAYRCEPPEMCPACHKGYLKLRGVGTERVESELHRLFPTASIGRMDLDTTRRRESHRAIYEAVKSRQINLLVGTQMIAKGLDFPQVTLVGVVSADTALNLPHFRAGERTFDLLTQVAGRAGRGDQPGRVVVQTYCPTHYAILAASKHDYVGFYHTEITMRKRLSLPPWTHLIEFTLRGSNRQRVHEAAGAFAIDLARRIGRRRMTLLGPVPHRVPRVRRTYQVCVLLKGRDVSTMVALARNTLQSGRRFRGMPVRVDVDPL